jgi:hypothetical protein
LPSPSVTRLMPPTVSIQCIGAFARFCQNIEIKQLIGKKKINFYYW